MVIACHRLMALAQQIFNEHQMYFQVTCVGDVMIAAGRPAISRPALFVLLLANKDNDHGDGEKTPVPRYTNGDPVMIPPDLDCRPWCYFLSLSQVVKPPKMPGSE